MEYEIDPLPYIKQKLRLVEERASNGLMDNQGIEDLKVLGIEGYPDEFDRMQIAIMVACLTGEVKEMNATGETYHRLKPKSRAGRIKAKICQVFKDLFDRKQLLYFWLARVERAAEEGVVYDRGIERLKQLNVGRYPKLEERVNHAEYMAKKIANLRDIQNHIMWVEQDAQDGYFYYEGYNRLEALGVHGYPCYVKRMEAAKELCKQVQQQLIEGAHNDS